MSINTTIEEGPALTAEYWLDAFGQEMSVLWGGVPQFKDQVGGLAHARAMTAWIEKGPNDILARKDLVAEYTRGVLRSDTVNRYKRLLPTESVVDKYLDNVVTFFGQASPPRRTFSTKDNVNVAFDTMYARARSNARLRDAVRAAIMTNVVAVYPARTSTGGWRLRYLTPDLFRVVTNADGDVVEFWTIQAIDNPGTNLQETRFQVFTKDFLETRNHKGKVIGDRIPNRYGRIPRVFLRMTEPTDGDFYGGGESDVAELCVWRNLIRFLSTRGAIFQHFQVGVATNMDLEASGVKSLGPDMFLEVDHMDPDVAPPGLEYVGPAPTFSITEDYLRTVTKDFFRNKGLPGFSVDEGAGTPPTGAALEVLERELAKKVEAYAEAVGDFERDLAELWALVANVDGGLAAGNMLPLELPEFSAKYTTGRRYMEPMDEYDMNMKKASDGMAYPSTVISEALGIRGGLSDEAAIKERDRLKAMWSGPAPTPPPVTPSPAPSPTDEAGPGGDGQAPPPEAPVE